MMSIALRSTITILISGLAFSAGAQAFPNGPVNLVVPLAPGDAADISARTIGEEISKALNVPVIVVNRPGAGGAVGAASVAQAKKDGQTILFPPNAALTFRAVLEPQVVTYDALRDFTPLGISSRTPSVLVVRGDAPYKTFAELVDYAKKNPGKVRIGHPGAGSVGDFCIRLVNALTDAGLEPVPHAGAAPAVIALRGGHIEGVVLALGALSQHIRSGRVPRPRHVETRCRTTRTSRRCASSDTRRTCSASGSVSSRRRAFREDARRSLAGAVEQAVKSPAVAAKLAPLGILQSYAGPESADRGDPRRAQARDRPG